MVLPVFWDFTGDVEDFYTCTYTNYHSEPSRNKTKKINIFTKIKWFMLILIWKFNNRKWKKCRQKSRSLDRYKETLMRGYNV